MVDVVDADERNGEAHEERLDADCPWDRSCVWLRACLGALACISERRALLLVEASCA